MEEVKSKVNTITDSIKDYLSNPNLSLVSEPRPWIPDIFSVSKFSKPNKEDIFNRGKENLYYFLPNYLLILFTILILGV